MIWGAEGNKWDSWDLAHLLSMCHERYIIPHVQLQALHQSDSIIINCLFTRHTTYTMRIFSIFGLICEFLGSNRLLYAVMRTWWIHNYDSVSKNVFLSPGGLRVYDAVLFEVLKQRTYILTQNLTEADKKWFRSNVGLRLANNVHQIRPTLQITQYS